VIVDGIGAYLEQELKKTVGTIEGIMEFYITLLPHGLNANSFSLSSCRVLRMVDLLWHWFP
jgi:hypothetical protein